MGAPSNPPEHPVRNFPSPEYLDGLVVTWVDNNKGDYQPLPIGTRLDEQADSKYAGYELVAQRTTGDYQWVQRFWCNPAVNQDVYNASIEYEFADKTKPTFQRRYIVRRPYTPLANLLPFTGVIAIVVTNGGSGYEAPPTVTIAGAGSGATAKAIIYRGAVVYVYITAEGSGYTSPPTVSFGSGSAAATAVIQPQTALLVDEQLGKLPADDPRFGLYDVALRTYRTLPGRELESVEKSAEFNGEPVTTSTQEAQIGTLPPETGNGIISSITTQKTSTIEQRRTVAISGTELPDDDVEAFWEYVPLPFLLFDITHDVFCNLSEQAKVITNYDTAFGSSQWRKHRKTTSWSYTRQDPDLSDSSFETNDIRYQGAAIGFSFNNVLNDALTFDGEVIIGGCTWDESYTFAATDPTATEFYAGMWVVRSFRQRRIGNGVWESEKIEYYSIKGNPAIE